MTDNPLNLPLDPGTARHGPPSQKRLDAYRRRLRDRPVDALAELIATGYPIREAAARLGIPEQKARTLFRAMCDRLGPQALGTWRIEWPPRDG